MNMYVATVNMLYTIVLLVINFNNNQLEQILVKITITKLINSRRGCRKMKNKN